jgi:tetratricopeptide (TPR) repeat protein
MMAVDVGGGRENEGRDEMADRREISEAARLHEEAQGHYDRGEYADARERFERALALRRAALGDDDLTTVQTLAALALVLAQQGEPAGAQPMLERVLSVREHVLGPDHPDTAEAINNLGYMRRMQGDNDAAQQLYERALAIRERTLGANDPATANSLSNLGVLAAAQRDFAAARRYHERALAIYERAIGPDAQETGRALNNLATVLVEQDERDAALPLLTRSLVIHERTLGAKHPSTANVLRNLADLYSKQRDYAAARICFERALIIQERTLGAAHPRTAEAVSKLASLLIGNMRDFALGSPLFHISQALKASNGHPDARTIDELHRIVDRLDAQVNRPPLPPADQQALAEAATLDKQADALLAQRDFAGAREALERALVLRDGVLGLDDMEQVPLLRKLSMALSAEGEYDRLLPVQERIVQIHARALGDNHLMTLHARTELMSMRAQDEGPGGTFTVLPEMEQIMAAVSGHVRPDSPLAGTMQATANALERLKAFQAEQAASGRTPGGQTRPPAGPPPAPEVMEAVLAGLDDVPWRTLQHAYGPAIDVPGQLRSLLAGDEHSRGRAYYHLHGNIWHQGTVYEASAYAVPFLIKLAAYAGTPDRVSVLNLITALAKGEECGPEQDEDREMAHQAAAAGLPLYLSLLESMNERELRAGAIEAVAAFPERAAESVPRLQAALAAERDREVRLWLMGALAQVMDASPASQALFADALASADDPSLRFLAAAALAQRAGAATPEQAVEALLAMVDAAEAADAGGGTLDVDEAMEYVLSTEWDGAVNVAVDRLVKLGSERAVPALLRAFQLTRTGDSARAVAEVLLDLTFNAGQIQPKGTATKQLPDGRMQVNYWEPAQQPERAAATLSAEQRALLAALLAHDPFWSQAHDLLALYGLPATWLELRALLEQG